jgi:hypothetical protein
MHAVQEKEIEIKPKRKGDLSEFIPLPILETSHYAVDFAIQNRGLLHCIAIPDIQELEHYFFSSLATQGITRLKNSQVSKTSLSSGMLGIFKMFWKILIGSHAIDVGSEICPAAFSVGTAHFVGLSEADDGGDFASPPPRAPNSCNQIMAYDRHTPRVTACCPCVRSR